MTTIYLVRHGETEANRQFRFQGCIDLPLTEDGIKQAERLAETLQDIPFDHFYSSPLPRAWNTANIVNKYHNAPLLPDPALLEVCGGKFEGQKMDVVKANWPEELRIWNEEYWRFVGPGLEEGVAAKFQQLEKALWRMVRNHPNQTILLSAHGCIQRAFNCIIKGWPMQRQGDFPWGFNCSYSAAEFEEDGTIRPIAINEAKHLEGFRVWIFDRPEDQGEREVKL